MCTTTNLIAAVSLAIISLATTASAQFGYTTSFGPGSPYVTGSLSGQDSWATNDNSISPPNNTNTGERIGQADGVGNGLYNGANAAGFSAGLGGRGVAVPNSTSISLSRVFSVSDYQELFKFDVDFAILSSFSTIAPPVNGSEQDTFGWSLRRTNNLEVASVTFVPFDASTLDIYTSSLGGPSIFTGSFISYDSDYHLTVFVNATTGEITTSFDGSAVNVTSGLVIGTTGDINRVAATQVIGNTNTLANGGGGGFTGAGNNQLVFDNYSAVPEPSTVALSIIAGVGGLVMIIRRRNKTA